MSLLQLIAAHKIVSLTAAAVVAAGAGTGAGFTLPSNAPQWEYTVDTLSMCNDNELLVPFYSGNYCMVMEVPVRYNGKQVEVTTLPAGNKWWNEPNQEPPYSVGLPWTGGLCHATNNGSNGLLGTGAYGDTVTSEWCGISESSQADGWAGSVTSGASFPVLMQDANSGWGPVPGQPSLQVHPVAALYLGMNIEDDFHAVVPDPLDPVPTVRTYPWVRAQIDAHGDLKCTVQGNPIGTGQNPLNTLFNGSDSPGAGEFANNGDCMPGSVPQGQPFTPVPQAPYTPEAPPCRDGGLSVNPPNQDPSAPVPGPVPCPAPPVRPAPTPTAPTPPVASSAPPSSVPLPPTGPGGVGLPVPAPSGPTLPPTGSGGVGLPVPPSSPTPTAPTPPPVTSPAPPANPPADAVAAWKATAGDASNTVGAALVGVAGLLPGSDTTQIAELQQLATIPLGGGLSEDPPAQAAEGQKDVTALDAFFGTPGLMPGEGAGTSAPSPAPSPSSSPSSVATPGFGSPEDAVAGFYQGELAGDWAAVCSYVTPSAQALCLAGASGQGAATGSATVGQAVISGSEALVPVTGSICAPGSPCVANSDPGAGMPSSPSQFTADYQAAVAGSTSDSGTTMSPMPCSQVNGNWYVDFG